jgi:glycosyltransferase involved in cell wall biosynthesis
MKKKKIDIILPVYNSKKYISETINSILKQTYKDWNLIIIDDCSNDGTYKILEDFKNKHQNTDKVFLYRNIKNKGQGCARNIGLKKSRSDYVAFIDSDDTWEKNKLKYQIKYMLDNKYNFQLLHSQMPESGNAVILHFNGEYGKKQYKNYILHYKKQYMTNLSMY